MGRQVVIYELLTEIDINTVATSDLNKFTPENVILSYNSKKDLKTQFICQLTLSKGECVS